MGYPSLGGVKKVQVPKAILEDAVSDPMKGCPEWHMEEGQQEYKMTLYNHGKVGSLLARSQQGGHLCPLSGSPSAVWP